MAKLLTLTIPNGTSEIVLTSDMYVDTWRQVECYHKNLAPAESYISLTIPYVQEVAQSLISHSDEDIKAVIKDGSDIIYTGYLRQSYKLSKTQNNQPIALELRSPSFFLDKEIGTDVCLQSKTVLYIMNYLFKSIGFYTTDKTAANLTSDTSIQASLLKTIDVAVFEESNKVNELLKTLCFEIGAVYNFDNKGQFKLYPLFDDITVSHEFTEDNMFKSVEVTKKEQEADSVNLNWTTKKHIEDAVIFADTQNGETDKSCKITIPSGEYLYGKENNKCEYDNNEGKVIWAENTSVTLTGISGYEAVNKGTYLALKYLNNSTQEQTITQFSVTGDAWVEVEGSNSTRSVSGKKTKDFNIKFLNNDDDISELAQKLAQYYKYQDFTIHVNSYDNVSIGSFASVAVEGIGTITARVIQKTTPATKTYYEYVLEASKELDVVSVVTKKLKQSSPYYDIQKQILNLNEKVEEVESNTLLMLFKRAAQKPSTAGIVGKGVYNFETGILTWNTGTDSRGWKQIQNLPSGDEPVYMTAAYITGKGTVTINDTQWSEPVLYVKNGENGENATSSYSIVPNFNIVTRYKDGTLSSDEIVFNFYQGNESSRGSVDLFYILYKRNNAGEWEEVSRGTDSSATYTITNEDGIHCDVYKTSADNVPLDSQTVMIVNEGQDSISVVLSNPAAFVAVNSENQVVDFENTATNLFVLCGAEFLNFGDSDTPGNFDFDILYTNCAAEGGEPEYTGFIVDENQAAYTDENGEKYQTVGSFILPTLTAMTAESASRSITVRGTSYNGSPFSYTIIQSFKKIHYGADGKSVSIKSIQYAVSNSSSSIPTSWSSTMPSVVNQGQYLWTKKVYKNESTGEESAEYTYTYKAQDGQRGLQGLQGEKGEQGIPGTNGKTTYFHIKYSAVANPTDADLTETPSKYIGTYVDFTEADSDQASKYTWARFEGIQGEQGEQGIPGTNGEDGQTSYLHIAYANSADGKTDFSISDSTGKSYIGQYVDFTLADSTKPSSYKWTKTKGEQGNQGIPGTDGKDGKTTYFHIKYSAVANPTDADLTETPSEYIGTYVDFTEADSAQASKYTWARFEGIQGEQGEQGIPGTNGEDGQTSYLHIAYANSADGKTDFSISDSKNKSYIGQYTDFVINDSTNPASYKWTEIKGEKGNDGADGSGGIPVILYKRAASQPALPTAVLTFKLANPPVLTWGTSGSSNGWVYDKPAVTSDKLPLWQISATAIFEGDSLTDKIQKTEWHLDGIVQLDNGLTEEETQTKIDSSINNYNKAFPEFSYSVDKYSFTTDSKYIAKQAQTICVTIDCKRENEDVAFEIVETVIPEVLKYYIFENKIYLTVGAGVEIHEDKIRVKVKLSNPKVESLICDETGANYFDENNEPFGNVEYYSDAIAQQTLEISYRVERGERNLGAVSSEASLPSDSLAGDYLVWKGDTISSKKSIDGFFRIGSVYKFDGEFWTIEDDPVHLNNTLDDVLSIADEDFERNNESLAENNSYAYTYVDHLTANDVFAKKVVSKLVEADLIISKETISNKFISYDSSIGNLEERQSAAEENINTVLDDYVTSNDISDMETKTELAQTLQNYVTGNTLSQTLASYVTENDLENKGYLIDEEEAQKIIDALSSSSTKTIIDGGLIKTGLIINDVTMSALVETTEIKAITGRIDNIESDYVKTETLEADYTKTTELESKYATIETLESNYASIDYLEGGDATFKGDVKANSLELLNTLNINDGALTIDPDGTLNATKGRFSAGLGFVTELSPDQGGHLNTIYKVTNSISMLFVFKQGETTSIYYGGLIVSRAGTNKGIPTVTPIGILNSNFDYDTVLDNYVHLIVNNDYLKSGEKYKVIELIIF